MEIPKYLSNVSHTFLNGSAHDNTSSLAGFIEESLPKKAAKTMAYCILFLVSLTGNTLIIWAIYRNQRLRTNTNILVANMAVSDLLLTLVAIPYMLMHVNVNGRWLIEVSNFGRAVCKLVPFLSDLPIAVSVYSCIFIAIDRYYAVARPFKGGFSRTRLKYIIPGIWTLAVLIHSPYFYSFNLFEFAGITVCHVNWNQAGVSHDFVATIFSLLMFSLISCLPNLSIAILYSLIVYKLRQHKVPGQSLDSVRMRREQQNKKVLKMSVAITSLLFFSKLMFDVLNGLLVFQVSFEHLSVSSKKDLWFASFWMVHSTCAFNFFVYLLSNDIYRQTFRSIASQILLLCRCTKTNNLVQPVLNVPVRHGPINHLELLDIKKIAEM